MNLDVSSVTNPDIQQFSLEPIPPWVTPISFSVDLPVDSSQINIQTLLLDLQVDIDSETTYKRSVTRILDQVGIQENSMVGPIYDPKYEKIRFHTIKIHRDGMVIDKFEPQKIQVIQREKDLERHLYDGSLSAILFLDDIREGDILEYAYSIEGFHPLLEGRFSYAMALQFGPRIEKFNFRLLSPENKNLKVRHFPSNMNRFMRKGASGWDWVQEPCHAYEFENDQPRGYRDQPYVEISEFNSWKEVAKWGDQLFALPADFRQNQEALALANQWAKESKEAEALSAVRFVQDKIRYLGLETGIQGWKPSNPNEILKRRFGDCKDKVQLLRALLDIMEIRSEPCLVNTSLYTSLPACLPSPNVFNHVILRIFLNNKIFWIDPTLVFQGGNLQSTFCPDYGFALPLSQRLGDLVPISQSVSEKGTEIATSFYFDEEDVVKMSVESRYFNDEADSMRYLFNTQRMSDLSYYFENQYVKYFGPLEAASPMEVIDDRDSNQVTLKESYILKNPWEAKNNEKMLVAYPLTIASYLNQPLPAKRKTPLKVEHPKKLKETIFFQKVGSDISIDIEGKKIENNLFSYSSNFSQKDGGLLAEYKLVTHKESLSPAELEDFTTQMKELWQNCQVTMSISPPSQPNSEFLGNVFISLLFLIWIVVFIYLLAKKA